MKKIQQRFHVSEADVIYSVQVEIACHYLNQVNANVTFISHCMSVSSHPI